MQVCKSRTLWKKGQGEQSLSLGRERIASGQNIDDFKRTPSNGSSRKASGSDVNIRQILAPLLKNVGCSFP